MRADWRPDFHYLLQIAGVDVHPLPDSDRQLQDYEWLLLAALYFPFGEVPHTLQIIHREGGGRTGAHNYNPPIEDSRGPLQLNVLAWPMCLAYNQYDPQVNLYFGGQIFRIYGWEPWRADGPHPWPWV